MGPAHESEVPTDWDRPQDVATPATGLNGDQLLDLVRLPATADTGPGTCSSTATTAEMGAVEAALGSRYAHITVTNTGSQACTLQGYPGIGARGAWDHPFVLQVEQTALTPTFGYHPETESLTPEAVLLDPGESAVVPFRYTGDLGGSDAEPLDALVLQLARDTPPVLVQAAAEQAFDLSMFTTVSVGPFQLQHDPDNEEDSSP